MFRIRLKELREQTGYSQYSFASVFGVAQSTVGGWEAGKREPNIDTLCRLAEFFNVSLDYLLGRVDNPQSAKKVLPIDGKDVTLTYHKDREPTDEEAKIAYEAALRALREHHNQD